MKPKKNANVFAFFFYNIKQIKHAKTEEQNEATSEIIIGVNSFLV